MCKEKCDYCGKKIEAEYMSALENGSPACPECVAKEENKLKKRVQKGDLSHGRKNNYQE